VAATAVVAAAGGGLAGVAAGVTAAPAAALPSIVRTWSVTLNDTGNPVALSSPVVADMAGGPAAVVGDRAGHVYAAYLSSGNEVPGWPVSTGGVPVDSPPSVGNGLIYFGVGNAAVPHSGGSRAYNLSGGLVWSHIENDPVYNHYQANGTSSGVTVGTLQGQPAVVAPSLGQNEDAYNATSGNELAGFPWFEGDTNFATAAIADVEGNGQNQIVEGGASTAGVAYGQTYTGGGHIRILSQNGAAGQPQPNDGLYCEYNTNQDVASSPAVGGFLAGGAPGVVAGTGDDAVYQGNSQMDTILAVNKSCQLAWSDRLNGDTSDSPALADILGTGGLEVVEGTRYSGGGTVYALDGATGHILWQTTALGGVFGGVTTADLFHQGYQDVIVPTAAGVEILDGRTGREVEVLEQGVGVQSSPLVTEDPNGTIGITVAGYNGYNQGVIQHFEVSGSSGSSVNETGAWPEFHHDPSLSGNAGTPPPVVQVPCKAPATTPHGYWMAGSDGGIFTFGNLPYCGGTTHLGLAAPIASMAPTRTGGGYWLAAANGAVWAFGDAVNYGSAAGVHLNRPIVGLVPTPDDKGYWLVASDGGIFTFGDAGYYGSTGGLTLNRPIVGMAPTADGKGYWEVASDGGIFTLGDAHYYGSMGWTHLNQPVVGMAATSDGKGYWLVASDGGIFTMGDAHYYGSMGWTHLNQPVVGMAATSDGKGYWLVASDGGIFTMGDAPYLGSTGGIHLARPIVGLAPAQ
jgi:hypothetical protein